MNTYDVTRNVLLYRIHVIFNEPLFWGAVLIDSLQRLAHMSLPDIYYMESVVLVLCVALDVPAGVLADLIGRKKCLIMGRMFLLVDTYLFASMQTPADAWTANVLWAIGFALQSGADSALLRDSLGEVRREHEFKEIAGKSVGGRYLLMALCALAIGPLATIHPRLPFYLGLPFMALPLIAVCFLKEPAATTAAHPIEKMKLLQQGCRAALHSAEVRWMVGLAALLATTSKVWFFTYNPYFELVGLPLTQYGVIFFCLNIVAWLSSRYAVGIERHLGERACIIGMVLCLGAPIMLMAAVPIQAFAYLVVIQNVVRGFMMPFVQDYLNRHIKSSVRATVLSVQSSFANLMAIVALASFGFLTGTLGLLPSLMLLGFSVTILGTWSYVTYVKKVA